MVTSIPVSTSLAIVKNSKRYTNNNIKPSADADSLLQLAQALNSLQASPADKFILTAKRELISV